jgi:hypothetical protein
MRNEVEAELALLTWTKGMMRKVSASRKGEGEKRKIEEELALS